MGHFFRKRTLPLSAEVSYIELLYIELMYCRADARLGRRPGVAYLLNWACEEMQKLRDDVDVRCIAQTEPDGKTSNVYSCME
jgi:hypothetical protein